MLVQASSLSLLPPSLSSSSTKALALLFDPASQSLAVTLTDSSVLLFSSFSAASSPSPPLSIPPVSTSACFLLVNPTPSSSSGRPLFVSASPSPSSSTTILCAWIRRSRSDLFAPIALTFKKRVGRLSGLAIDLRHGFGVRVAGSVNVLVVHSIAESEIWVLGVRMVGGEREERVELEKCAVIECTRPIYQIRVAMGVLVLGEVGGVRVFPLRPMVKGEQGLWKKRKDLNGVGAGEQRTCGRLRTLKLRQDSGDLSSFFAMMKCAVIDAESSTGVQASLKVVAIHVLSQKKFLILDSIGDLYLLSLQNTVIASETCFSATSTCGQMNRLDVTMKVQLLSILPDMCAKMQVLWLSDGAHTVHVTSMTDMEHSVRETDENETMEKEMLISAIQVIFTSEKVQDIVPLSANAILVLGQESIFSYSIA